MTAQEQQVLEAMRSAGQPVKAGDVAQATGLDKEEVAKILKKLKNQGRVHSPKTCFYEPL